MKNWTIRIRLTVLYCGLFLLGTAAVLGLTYVLVQRSLDSRLTAGGQIQIGNGLTTANDPAGEPNQTVTFNGKVVSPEQANSMINNQSHQFRDDTLNSLLTQGGIALGGVGVAAIGFGWLMTDRV